MIPFGFLSSFADQDAVDWFYRVEAAGGSFNLTTSNPTYTDAYTKSVWAAFVSGCKADGNWGLLLDFAPFFGVKGVGALTQKMVRFSGAPTLTNYDYVAADLTPAGASLGLLGNSTKYLDTNAYIPSLPSAISFGALTGDFYTGGNSIVIGSSYGATGDTDRFYVGYLTTTPGATGHIGNFTPAGGPTSAGLYSARAAGASGNFLRNGVLLSSAPWNGLGAQPGTLLVGAGAEGNHNLTPIRAYYVSDWGLDHVAFSNRLNTALAAFA